jgi:hypothetical protein
MDENVLQEKIRALQEKYVALLTQAAQEGRTDDVASLNDQMQQEIQLLTHEAMQSAMSGVETARADTDEVGGSKDDIDDSWDDDDEDDGDDDGDDEDEDDENDDDGEDDDEDEDEDEDKES